MKIYMRDNYEVIKRMGGKVNDFFSSIYLIPSFMRKNPEKDPIPLNILTFFEELFLSVCGIAGYTTEGGFDSPYLFLPSAFLGAHISTNVASGVYEWFREEKNDLIQEKESEQRRRLKEDEKILEEARKLLYQDHEREFDDYVPGINERRTIEDSLIVSARKVESDSINNGERLREVIKG